MLIHADHLIEPYREGVKALLFAADNEFIPPLSSRSGTTQTELGKAAGSESGPELYFQGMARQAFVICEEEGRVLGFLSYIPDRMLALQEKAILCDYVSTIIVSPSCRGQGITGRMYRLLMEKRLEHIVATRTWSGNAAHLHLLAKLGFEEALRLKDDRGPGIDTVYMLHRPEN